MTPYSYWQTGHCHPFSTWQAGQTRKGSLLCYPEKCIIPKNEQKVFYNLGLPEIVSG